MSCAREDEKKSIFETTHVGSSRGEYYTHINVINLVDRPDQLNIPYPFTRCRRPRILSIYNYT